jgi:hypothetical protein
MATAAVDDGYSGGDGTAGDDTTDPAAQKPTGQIGLWGASSSGKTTFLAALQIATNDLETDEVWSLHGINPDSNRFLDQQTRRLQEDHTFPDATTVRRELAWRFVGREAPDYGRSRRRQPPPPGQKIFTVRLIDMPGEDFNPDYLDTYGAGGAADDDIGPDAVLQHLVDAEGIVYLYDPVREAKVGDAFQYFQRTVNLMMSRAFDQDLVHDGRLPHHLAVCVTKLDDPVVYQQAWDDGWLRADPRTGMPTVPGDLAEAFFESLTSDRSRGTSYHVRRGISRFFDADRVGYFVSSAIGFRLDRAGQFDVADPLNVVAGEAPGQMRIRGPIQPINILEPILWLQDRIREGEERAAAQKQATEPAQPSDKPRRGIFRRRR